MNWRFWVAVGFGSGRSPIAAGTTGTLGVLPLIYAVWDQPLAIWLVGFTVLIALNYGCIAEAGRILGEVDHGQIVIDEWAGMWLAAAGVQFFTALEPLTGLLIGFIGFRMFDIFKPWPVSWFERSLSGATGVLLDDLAAGIYVVLIAWVSGIIVGLNATGLS